MFSYRILCRKISLYCFYSSPCLLLTSSPNNSSQCFRGFIIYTRNKPECQPFNLFKVDSEPVEESSSNLCCEDLFESERPEFTEGSRDQKEKKSKILSKRDFWILKIAPFSAETYPLTLILTETKPRNFCCFIDGIS